MPTNDVFEMDDAAVEIAGREAAIHFLQKLV
jgi:hypothetical protein